MTGIVIGADCTAAAPVGDCVRFEALIKPAILRLLSEEEGGYRVERDLHHHLTICFGQIAQIRLGRRDRLVRYEEPTTAKYSWKSREDDISNGRKAGNVDFFFPAGPASPRIGAALEVNFGYCSTVKIQQDFIKLLDPRNGYKQMVYFAYGLKPDFREFVGEGLRMAFEQVRAQTADFALPIGLHILVLENPRRRGGTTRHLWEADLRNRSSPDNLIWKEILLAGAPEGHANEQVAATDEEDGTNSTEETTMATGSAQPLSGFMNLTVSNDEAIRLIDGIGHATCTAAASSRWHVTDRGKVRAQSMYWLFCWGKTGMGGPTAAREARHVFDSIFPVKFSRFDVLVPHAHARRRRYSVQDIDAELVEILNR
ncbi:MAG: hypothetical protein ABSF25_03865 [Bryobacteraceae bacterium]